MLKISFVCLLFLVGFTSANWTIPCSKIKPISLSNVSLNKFDGDWVSVKTTISEDKILRNHTFCFNVHFKGVNDSHAEIGFKYQLSDKIQGVLKTTLGVEDRDSGKMVIRTAAKVDQLSHFMIAMEPSRYFMLGTCISSTDLVPLVVEISVWRRRGVTLTEQETRTMGEIVQTFVGSEHQELINYHASC